MASVHENDRKESVASCEYIAQFSDTKMGDCEGPRRRRGDRNDLRGPAACAIAIDLPPHSFDRRRN